MNRDTSGVALNEGHLVEALDRTHVAICCLEVSLQEHALIATVPAFSARVETAIDILASLYQDIGRFKTIKEVEEAFPSIKETT